MGSRLKQHGYCRRVRADGLAETVFAAVVGQAKLPLVDGYRNAAAETGRRPVGDSGRAPG